jgi:hypothetical protein
MKDVFTVNRRNLAILSVAGLAGGYALLGNEQEQPVRPAEVSAFAAETARDISRIPVTEAEVKRVCKSFKRTHGEDSQIHTDEKTGQPYRVSSSGLYGTRVQVRRSIEAEGSESTYEFTINERLDPKGSLDPGQTTYVDVDAGPKLLKDRVSISVYESDRSFDWGGSVTEEAIIQSEVNTDTNVAERHSQLVLTPERFQEIQEFMTSTVNEAMNHAPIQRYPTPDILVYNP